MSVAILAQGLSLMSGRVDTRERQEAPDINIVATAAGSLSLPSLKSSRTTARAARTRLANRLAAQRQVIRDREAEGVGEEDPELHALLVEEEELSTTMPTLVPRDEMAGIIFHEAGLGTLDNQGIFTATVPETILVTKYLQSLENVVEVYERAMDVAIQTKYRWWEMSDILNQVFGDRVRPTITEWASNFPGGSVVYFRTDKAISPESIRKTSSDLGAKEVRAHVHKRGHRYGFATFDNKAEASKLIHNGVPASSKGTSQGLKIRAFVPEGNRGRLVMKSGN
ncbi:hypothetical protein Pmar_PMAR011118 [Perkinsus marinus ATCC 50983]|uniref:Uncharacterized protein n=1 Tax=Perkinsus marinus (strain ATCC 50983 / TXsc) TaxID=423536 RepID=C5KVR7_PERM5|nr:hypothetical protein Pmar_PMAR011118 [Perkinsus marinus ATCC 50983]EER11452.1 hypothetical protein Pmar_PMAR011118 [Perkinsus marinus ATCC 50983]|eukprot:XP_002779657.1 hypothetical protein Pmar_PMAR011118 [Perkinsus marinus ATCC 50983]